MIIENIENIN